MSQIYQKIDVNYLLQTPLSILLNKVAEHVIQECIEEKEAEIAEIKTQYEKKNSSLMGLQKTMENLSESMTNEEKSDNVSREDIIKEIFSYFDKEDKELNAILKRLEITSKGLKKHEKIFQILTTKKQDIFNKK